MTKETIREGLIIALQKGVPFQRAVHTFISAGYPEEDIRAAVDEIRGIQSRQQQIQGQQPAKTSQIQPQQTTKPAQVQPLQKPLERQFPVLPAVNVPQKKPEVTPQQQIQKIPQQIQQQPIPEKKLYQPPQTSPLPSLQKTQPAKPTQVISKYEGKSEKESSVGIIIAVVLLFLLIGSLIAFIIFKEEVLRFIDNLLPYG